jgi:hemerythrin-like domain-containing protein
MNSSSALDNSRRDILRAGLAMAGVSFLGASTVMAQLNDSGGKSQPFPQEAKKQKGGGEAHEEEEVSPAEDLMREHGVLTRVLLIYDEAAKQLDAGARDLSPEPLKQSAALVRSFVEDYHEKLEESYLFPRFKKANTLVELVDTLQAQHNAGRRVTDMIIRLATQTAFKDDAERRKLIEALRQFIRMYLPHEAREDTVLFPAFRKLVSGSEYDALGEEFEKKEHELFGEGGFQAIVEKVAGIEKQLGIYDLAQFTPKPQ